MSDCSKSYVLTARENYPVTSYKNVEAPKYISSEYFVITN